MHLVSSVVTLALLQDPIGNLSVCLCLLNGVPKHRRQWIILRENLLAFCIACLFLVSGQSILYYLHVTTTGLGMAGGLLLLLVAFNRVFSDEATSDQATLSSKEPFIVPLATPLLMGPSLISQIIVYSTKYPGDRWLCLLALFIVSLLSSILLSLALPLSRLLGTQVLKALEKITGVILVIMATQMILDNLSTYLKVGVV